MFVSLTHKYGTVQKAHKKSKEAKEKKSSLTKKKKKKKAAQRTASKLSPTRNQTKPQNYGAAKEKPSHTHLCGKSTRL